MISTRSVSKTSTRGSRRTTSRMNTEIMAEIVSWGLTTRTKKSTQLLLSALAMRRSSLFYMVRGKVRTDPYGTDVADDKLPKRPTKRNKASSSKANSTATVLKQESALK